MKNELIVAGFENAQSAMLAQAALERMQTECSLSVRDTVLVTHDSAVSVTVRSPITLSSDKSTTNRFWETLVDLIFHPDPPDDVSDGPLHKLGIEGDSRESITQDVPVGGAAIFVLTDHKSRGGIQALLVGFRAKLTRIRMVEGNKQKWLNALIAADDEK